MRQTLKPYIRRVEQIIPGVRSQIQAWPYPQADDSHIAFWLADWPHEPGMMPTSSIRVPIVGSDIPGALMRVAEDAPTPAELATQIADRALGIEVATRTA